MKHTNTQMHTAKNNFLATANYERTIKIAVNQNCLNVFNAYVTSLNFSCRVQIDCFPGIKGEITKSLPLQVCVMLEFHWSQPVGN